MVIFEDIEDVQDWLEPLDFVAFWEAVAPYSIFALDDRAHFDGVIARGVTSQETVLTCLKAEARMALTERFGLTHRIYDPADRPYLTRVH